MPELTYILKGDEARPVTRLFHGTRYALGVAVAAHRIARYRQREVSVIDPKAGATQATIPRRPLEIWAMPSREDMARLIHCLDGSYDGRNRMLVAFDTEISWIRTGMDALSEEITLGKGGRRRKREMLQRRKRTWYILQFLYEMRQDVATRFEGMGDAGNGDG